MKITTEGRSWRSTLWGICSIISGAGLVVMAFLLPVAVPVAVIAAGSGIANINSGIGLLFTKDAKVAGVPNAKDADLRATTPETIK